MKRIFWLSVFAGVMFTSAGCGTMCQRRPLCGGNDPPVVKPVYVAPAPIPQPMPIQQSGGFPVLPPGAVVNPPPGAIVNPPPGAIANPPPGAGGVPSISKTPERPLSQWLPGETPEPELKRDLPPSIKLYAPEPIDKETPKPDKEPPLGEKPNTKGGFPAIAQFAEAQKNVYAGLRPSLDGLDWLQANGVQTVVQIRRTGEDAAADKKQVEKRDMRYVAFEVSPDALTKEKADEFVKLIRDGAKQGIFVYDEDGSLAGAMWYIHLRYGEFLEDGAAQIRAGQLGLQTTADGQHREMWLAARKLVSENNP